MRLLTPLHKPRRSTLKHHRLCHSTATLCPASMISHSNPSNCNSTRQRMELHCHNTGQRCQMVCSSPTCCKRDQMRMGQRFHSIGQRCHMVCSTLTYYRQDLMRKELHCHSTGQRYQTMCSNPLYYRLSRHSIRCRCRSTAQSLCNVSQHWRCPVLGLPQQTSAGR